MIIIFQLLVPPFKEPVQFNCSLLNVILQTIKKGVLKNTLSICSWNCNENKF